MKGRNRKHAAGGTNCYGYILRPCAHYPHNDATSIVFPEYDYKYDFPRGDHDQAPSDIYPDIYQMVLDRGHRVGNHTYNHIQGIQYWSRHYVDNVHKASEYIHSNLFRPPHAYGCGLSYGYDLYLSSHWNVEFTAGLGYIRFKYDKSSEEGSNSARYRNNYFGPTKVGVSFVYLIK